MIITKPFYSNCIIEAIKAKIKNPKNVKFTIIWKINMIFPHIMWTDGKYDYDFGFEKHQNISMIHLVFYKGVIHKRNLGFNKKFKKDYLNLI